MAGFPLIQRPMLSMSCAIQDARVHGSVAVGIPKLRRRFTARARLWNVTLPPINGVELQTLLTFYFTATVEGTLPFTWADETGTIRNFRFATPIAWTQIVGHHIHARKLFEVSFGAEQLP